MPPALRTRRRSAGPLAVDVCQLVSGRSLWLMDGRFLVRKPKRRRPLTRARVSPPPGIHLQELADAATYVISREHKDYLTEAGPGALRSDASPCPRDVPRETAEVWLREAIAAGHVGAPWAEQPSPQYVWYRSGDTVFEARVTNAEQVAPSRATRSTGPNGRRGCRDGYVGRLRCHRGLGARPWRGLPGACCHLVRDGDPGERTSRDARRGRPGERIAQVGAHERVSAGRVARVPLVDTERSRAAIGDICARPDVEPRIQVTMAARPQRPRRTPLVSTGSWRSYGMVWDSRFLRTCPA